MVYTEQKEYSWHGEKQDLPGFDEKYLNIVDYILEITEEIWEKRAIWVIYDTYADDVVIHSGGKKIKGIDAIIEGTLKTLYSFPDRKMHGEAVIWSQDEDSFHSSHRILSDATNMGDTTYGPATGRSIKFRTIADCKVRANRIIEEWLVRDNLFLIEQIGFDPIEESIKEARYKQTPLPQIDRNKELRIVGSGYPAHLVSNLLVDTYKKQDHDAVSQYYHIDARIHGIRNKEYDVLGYLDHVRAVLSPFSSKKFYLERISVNASGRGHEVAARWVMTAKHTGSGFFGAASDKNVFVRFINHYYLEEEKIKEEWMVFDGYDVLCQINS